MNWQRRLIVGVFMHYSRRKSLGLSLFHVIKWLLAQDGLCSKVKRISHHSWVAVGSKRGVERVSFKSCHRWRFLKRKKRSGGGGGGFLNQICSHPITDCSLHVDKRWEGGDDTNGRGKGEGVWEEGGERDELSDTRVKIMLGEFWFLVLLFFWGGGNRWILASCIDATFLYSHCIAIHIKPKKKNTKHTMMWFKKTMKQTKNWIISQERLCIFSNCQIEILSYFWMKGKT